MTRQDFPNAFYCDARPDGSYVVLWPDAHLETHLGTIEFLDMQRQPLFPRIAETGIFRFAGQSWYTNETLEWDGQWRVISQTACGVSPVIYDRTGTLHISDCSIGSQGWRYVSADDVLVTGDATYGPAAQAPLLYEWTQLLPDLTVGQGAEGGILVWDGTTHRVVVAGPATCRFIRARISGDAVSIAWWGSLGTPTGIIQTTVSELRSLPVYVPPVTPPTPLPPIPPLPPETPMTPDHSHITAAVYAEGGFRLDTHDGCGLFTEACARALHAHDPRWGHLLKRPGQNQFRGHAVDAILYRHDGEGNGVAVDIIRANATPDAAPGWSPDIPRYGSSDWEAPESVPVSRITRPSMPFLIAATCFDLGVSRDFALVDELKAAGVNTLRIVVASKFRTERSLETGRLQLRSLLPKLIERGMKASVVVNCDTAEYGLSELETRSHTMFVNTILREYPAAVALVELFNENSHGVEQPYATDPYFLRDLDTLIDAQFPVAWGATHGGEAVSDRLAGGSVICVHSDRSKTAAENAYIMAEAQTRFGKPVVNMEPKGMDEQARGEARTGDPTDIRAQAFADKAAGLGGSCYHFEAGLTASSATPPFGPKQREALRLFGEVLAGTTPQPPIPPTPPPTGDKVLDAPLTPAYPVGYDFFVNKFEQIQDEAEAWYYRAHKRFPAPSDIAHGLWRALNEGERWKTLRGAFEETWPGGGR